MILEFTMKEKFFCVIRKKYFIPVLLSVIIFGQLVNIVSIIVSQKKAFHSDEIFSYALANSFYEPYLDTDSIRSKIGDGHENYFGHWIPADVLREYVTVQKGEQFRYDSVWYNQSKDRHPPLYYSVIHTVSSFFPDTFSYAIGFAVNLVCFVIIQIFLYKLSREILKSEYLAVTVCLFWGFSCAAVELTIFIRMYCMLAMWAVIFLYIHARLAVQNSKFVRQLIAVSIVTVSGALTQYLFLFVAFVTAVFFCIRYLYQKQVRRFLAYGFSMLGSVAAAFLIFPSYLPNMLSESNHSQTDFWEQFELCLRYLTDPVFPVSKSALIFWIPTLSAVTVTLILLSVPVLYLFRDKKLVIDLIVKLKRIPSYLKSVKAGKILMKIVQKAKSGFMLWIIFAVILLVISLTAYTVTFASMFYIDRYLFIIYPVTALLISCIIYFVFSWSRYKKHITVCILMLTMLLNFHTSGFQYTFSGDTDVSDILSLTDHAECIFTSSEYLDLWMICYLPAVMYDADHIFVTYTGGQQECREQLESIDTERPVYLFMQTPDIDPENAGAYLIDRYDRQKDMIEFHSVTENEYQTKYVDFYKNLSVTKNFEYIGEYSIFTRTYDVYRLA